jgi:hypothetical protein
MGLKQARMAQQSEADGMRRNEDVAFSLFDLSADSMRAAIEIGEMKTGLSALGD